MFAYKILLGLFVLLCCVHWGESVKCYECTLCDNPSEDKVCEDEYCWKMDMHGWYRGCDTNGKACDGMTGHLCEMCQEDFCNSAVSTSGSLVLCSVAALLFKLFY